MNTAALKAEILKKKSFLCVGLDIDLEKVPAQFQNSPTALVDFSKAIIDATASYAVAYKPNIAFFETYGVEGMAALKKLSITSIKITQKYLPLPMQNVGILEIRLPAMQKLILRLWVLTPLR